MAFLYISEYANAGSQYSTGAQIAIEPSAVDQAPVAIGGASVQSAAFANGTRFVRVHVDAICSIAFGANPTATASSKRLPADWTEYFGVNQGDKIAVITNV